MKPLYTATATAHGGREGKVTTSDGHFQASLSMPKELGGPGGTGTNPEQLFAAGYAACFESALRHIARLNKTPITDASVTAEVQIGALPSGGFGLAVKLRPSLPGIDRALANELVAKAHQICPYSNATRNNIPVDLSLE